VQPDHSYVSRGGVKLAAALDAFQFDVRDLRCADLGSHVGGFVDCLLRRGAAKVFAVDTAYGTLAWKLRRDPCVVVLERTNALHVALPEPVDLLTIDLGWTPQRLILPRAATLLHLAGHVITLIKPQYEAQSELCEGGVVPPTAVMRVVETTLAGIRSLGWEVLKTTESPIHGHGGNIEWFALLQRNYSLGPSLNGTG